MHFVGIIHSVNLKNKVFSIRNKTGVKFFYLQNNLIKKFKKYLEKGRYVAFDYDEDKIIVKNKITSFQVNYFTKIIRKTKRRNIKYYDLKIIQSGIRDLINSLENVMFLDLEMTMQDYHHNEKFKTEIIQAGYIIVDKDNNVLCEKSNYVKPTVCKRITARTYQFLGINKDDLKDAISYKEFYKDFKNVLNTYHPTILVWGKNDIKVINDSYSLNKVKSLADLTTFINLLSIQKNYFNLKNDLGLFRAYSIYNHTEDIFQAHDALADARVTFEVYKLFKEIINQNEEFVFPK